MAKEGALRKKSPAVAQSSSHGHERRKNLQQLFFHAPPLPPQKLPMGLWPAEKWNEVTDAKRIALTRSL